MHHCCGGRKQKEGSYAIISLGGMCPLKDAAEQSQQKEEAEASNGEDIVKLEELVREKIAEVHVLHSHHSP